MRECLCICGWHTQHGPQRKHKTRTSCMNQTQPICSHPKCARPRLSGSVNMWWQPSSSSLSEKNKDFSIHREHRPHFCLQFIWLPGKFPVNSSQSQMVTGQMPVPSWILIIWLCHGLDVLKCIRELFPASILGEKKKKLSPKTFERK